MRLKTKLLLATSVIVLVILGLSEWIGYRQTAQFLSRHELSMAAEMSHETALAELQQGRREFFAHSVTLHALHALLTILTLVFALNALWRRTVLRPIEDLLRHINSMGHGDWTTPVLVARQDEIGKLAAAFNRLGGQLALAVYQHAAAAKLSALALLGQSLVNKVQSAVGLLKASLPSNGGERSSLGAGAERARLLCALKILEEIPGSFEVEFQREFGLHSVRLSRNPADSPEDPGPASNGRPGSGSAALTVLGRGSEPSRGLAAPGE